MTASEQPLSLFVIPPSVINDQIEKKTITSISNKCALIKTNGNGLIVTKITYKFDKITLFSGKTEKG